MNVSTNSSVNLFLGGRRYLAACREDGDQELSLDLLSFPEARANECEQGRLVGLSRDGGFMAAEIHAFCMGEPSRLTLRIVNDFVVPIP